MPPKNSTASARLQLLSLLNSINHIFIFLVGGFFTVLAYSLEFKDTAMHMFLTGVGYHVLMAEAMMSHYPLNPVTRWFSYRNKSRFHGLLQLVGGTMALLGALGKISQKEVHFTTWHGKFGLVTTIFCAASLLGGLVNFFQPKFALKVYPPSELKFRHNLFGLIPFTLGMSTIFLGYYSKFILKHVDKEVIPALMIATTLTFLLSVLAPVSSLLDKLKYRWQKRTSVAK